RALPIYAARAAADPPPGVGSDEAKAESRSRTDLSISMMNDLALLDHRADGVGADANQVDRWSGDDDGVHLLADFEAADVSVPVQRIRGVDRGADQRLLEGQPHGEARERHRERHRRRETAAGIHVGRNRHGHAVSMSRAPSRVNTPVSQNTSHHSASRSCATAGIMSSITALTYAWRRSRYSAGISWAPMNVGAISIA